MKVVLCQISNRVINWKPPGYARTAAEFMYESQWVAKESYGYWKLEDFWELPLWIGEVTYALRPEYQKDWEYDVELHIVTPENFHDPLPEADIVCFSAMDVNKQHIKNLIADNPGRRYYVGGYIKPEYFKDVQNVTWCKDVKYFCECLFVDYHYGVDWSLFKGMKCIPRLTMSYGCSHNCRFCTVSNKVEEVSWTCIMQQVQAMRDLEFKLVYLNDKTWGMAQNHELLHVVYDAIKSFNPEFEGFIVQTSVALMQSFENHFTDEMNYMKHAGIKVIELGVETFNDKLLKEYRKPQRERQVNHVVEMLSERGFHVIANLILGFPGETKYTYYRTLGWLAMNFKNLFGVNINTLALYHDCDLGKELGAGSGYDVDQLAEDRSFWTDQERRDFNEMKYRFYDLITEIWYEKRVNVPVKTTQDT